MRGIRCEISSVHGLYIWSLPAVPRIGEHIRLPDVHNPGHDDDLERIEQITAVIWHEDGAVTIDADCVANR